MVPKKKRVLIFIDWFYPAYKAGGPIKSVFHIAENLSADFDFFIVCSNQDLDGEVLSVEPNQWINSEHYQAIYLDQEHQNGTVYHELFEEIKAQVIYYNNMFSIPFGIMPLWSFRNEAEVKQIIAPRGMLGAGALKIKSLKKQLFLSFAKFFLYKQHLIWHASTKQEEQEVKGTIGNNARVRVARNLSSKPSRRKLDASVKTPQELKLVFISRISPKKNLLYLLELLQDLKNLTNLSLDIYGPTEERDYWQECEKLIKADRRIKYKDILKPTQIDLTLKEYHLYVLPTLHENFGHSIAEAINAGIPVMVSKFTPWQNLQEAGIGYDIDLEYKERWKERLTAFYQIDQSEYKKMVNNCYDYANRNIVNSSSLEANRKLFSD